VEIEQVLDKVFNFLPDNVKQQVGAKLLLQCISFKAYLPAVNPLSAHGCPMAHNHSEFMGQLYGKL
jgi:hypothetical protein